MFNQTYARIANEINIPSEVIMLLLESSVEVAHKIYIQNIKRLGKNYGDGWAKLRDRSRESNKIISDKESKIKEK